MQRKRALPGWLIPAGILLAVVALVLAATLGVRAFSRRNDMRVGQAISIGAQGAVKPFLGDYLFEANQTLYCVSPSGETRWTLPLTRADAPYDVMGENLCIAEEDALYVYKRGEGGVAEESWHKSLQGLLMDEVVCGRTHLALLTDTRSTIYVLAQDGSQVDTMDLPGQTVIDLGFYSQGDLMWVVSLDAQGGAPLTNIRIYEPGKSTIAMQSFSDELVSTMVIDSKNGVALTLGTQYISAIDISSGTGVSTGQATSIYGYQYVCDNGASDCRIVLAPAVQLVRQSVIDLAVYHSGEVTNLSLPTECQAFAATDRFLYAANASTVYRMSYDGQVLEQIDLTGLYDRVQAVDNHHLFFFDGASATIITLK